MSYTSKIIILILVTFFFTSGANRPFPQAINFPGCIKPENVTQEQMNGSITALYDYYKSSYLKSYNVNQNYIEASGNGENGDASLTISEAHGYGMIIFALMDGYDNSAQSYFDGMYRFYKDWGSKYNNYLMSWIAGGVSPSNSATDGDMDIAYALILADLQWGSNGDINYLKAAQDMINHGIKVEDMSTSTNRIMLGDWDGNDYTTRSSDWMPGHLRAYKDVTGDTFWNDAVNEVYSLISEITTSYSSSTGLMPDFIAGSAPYPDETGGGTGEHNADKYWYNACRYPWRIALDYAHNGSTEAQDATSKLLGWLRVKTGEDVSKIKAGYDLSGNALSSYNDLVFTAPFAAGAITDPANQSFLNSMWTEIKSDKGSDEYALALNILSMMLISGNWWSPGEVEYAEPTKVDLSNSSIKENSPSGTFIGKLSTDGNGTPFTYTLTSGGSYFSISGDSLFSSRTFTTPTDESFNITIKVTDNQSKSAQTDFIIIIKEASSNKVFDFSWYIEHDNYGITSVDTGASLVDDSSVVVDFTLGRTQANQGKYAWASLSTNDISDLNRSNKITIKYRCNNDFSLTLEMDNINDYDYHRSELPNSNGQWSEITLDLNEVTFKQPTGDSPVTFDINRISTLSFDALFEETTGFFEISNISFDSTTPIINLQGEMKLHGLNASIISNKLLIKNPLKGTYNISIHTLNGKRIYNDYKNLKVGKNSVDLSNLNIGSQLVLVNIRGERGRAAFKILLQ